MAKNILKEAIADAKAVREVALANAKAALEEAFTPKLQSMLSAKLSETLNEEEDELEENYMDEEIDETMDEMDVEEEMDEIAGMDEEETSEGADLDEEIDLEEILNELELEEGAEAEEETVDEAKKEEDLDEAKDDEKDLEEIHSTNPKADDVQQVIHKAEDIYEEKDFDLDALLEEINNLDENEDEVNEYVEPQAKGGVGSSPLHPQKGETMADYEDRVGNDPRAKKILAAYKANPEQFKAKTMEEAVNPLATELEETKAALKTVRTELNEVNLLNSKLLYVNRIFKANTLDESQKLRVVETLDKAETAKEAKLIYETIKDTFTVANNKKASFKNKTKSLKEGIGMASKAAGTSTAPKKEILSESNDMMTRFQKLANIKINQ